MIWMIINITVLIISFGSIAYGFYRESKYLEDFKAAVFFFGGVIFAMASVVSESIRVWGW